MNFFDFSFWQNFGSNLLETVIGVAIGIPVAFWINRRLEKATESDKKQKILRTLLNELEDILDYVVTWKDRIKNKGWDHPIPAMNTMVNETWKAFSDGGELQWIRDSDLLRQLGATYSKVSYVKFLSDSVLKFRFCKIRFSTSDEYWRYTPLTRSTRFDVHNRVLTGDSDLAN